MVQECIFAVLWREFLTKTCKHGLFPFSVFYCWREFQTTTCKNCLFVIFVFYWQDMAVPFLGKVVELHMHEVCQLQIYGAKKSNTLVGVGKKCCTWSATIHGQSIYHYIITKMRKCFVMKVIYLLNVSFEMFVQNRKNTYWPLALFLVLWIFFKIDLISASV